MSLEDEERPWTDHLNPDGVLRLLIGLSGGALADVKAFSSKTMHGGSPTG